MKDYDAVVVGAGPNGLAAAITLQRKGLSVLIIEKNQKPGGGMRSDQLTLPGFIHDCCSSVFPFAVNTPFFDSIDLSKYGVEFIYPPAFVAHPFYDGSALLLFSSMEKTVAGFGEHGIDYQNVIGPLLKNWDAIKKTFLAPLHFPAQPFKIIRFAKNAIKPASFFFNKFRTEYLRALWAGIAAHSMLPLQKTASSAAAFMLLLMGHHKGWPIVKGGAQQITDVLLKYFISIGGKIETGIHIEHLKQLPSSRTVFLNVTPHELLKIAGHRFSRIYKWQIKRYRYGPGIYKVDWALSEAIPFINKNCHQSATVHLGSSSKEIVASEKLVHEGQISKHPFVILTQPSLFDRRAPGNYHTAWGYCHVPTGYTLPVYDLIEDQVERVAPGFRDCILARHVMGPQELETYNTNYKGGDISGGLHDIRQLFTRPALRWSPYKTSAKGIYICSSSTPPGAGVHGLCGYHAANKALREIFGLRAVWD